MRDTIGQPISRSGSARSFNTTFGRPATTPSPRPPRANYGPQSLGPTTPSRGPPSPSPQARQQQVTAKSTVKVVSESRIQLLFQEFLRQQAEYRARQEQELQREQREREHQQRMQQQHSLSVKDTVRDIIANTDFSNFDPRPRSPSAGRSRVIQVRP